jgi:hypothetical protein
MTAVLHARCSLIKHTPDIILQLGLLIESSDEWRRTREKVDGVDVRRDKRIQR